MILPAPPSLAVGLTAPLLAAGGVAAVGIPVAIHILSRMRRQPVRWGAMRFLEIAYRQQKNKLRLENWLLLAVRCLIVGILGLALSGPVLTGCAGSLTSGLDTSGRVVHLVIDDALSSTAQETADQTRFQRHIAEAKQIIDTLEPRDRVAVWALARPARAVVADATPDRESIAQALDALAPRASRSDLPAALELVGEQVREDGTPRDRALVVVLGDLAGASAHWSEPTPAALANLGDRARVLVAAPSAASGNVQLTSLTPRRTLVLARSPDGGSAGAVAVALTARRFAAGAEDASATLDLTVRDAEGKVVSRTQRDARWAPGQVEATLNVELPLDNGSSAADGPVAVEARLAPGALPDAIPGDNVLLATAEVRGALAVGLIDEPGNVAADAIAPGEFVARALAPLTEVNGSGMRVAALSPTTLTAETIDALDAAVLLRPDLLPAGAWEQLAQFTARGGLLWVVVPPGEASAVWTDPMRRAFELDWRIGLEPVSLAESAGGLALDTGARAPEALELIGANWGELLRPVRVTRKLECIVPADQAWLALEDKATPRDEDALAEAPGLRESTTGTRRALLAQQRVGEGSVLLLSAALDADWTNLPTKPVFVPLLHETLRGVLGSSPRGIGLATAGDQPTLGAGWVGVAQVQQAGTAEQPGVVLALRPIGDGLVTTQAAAEKPGVYRAASADGVAAGGLLAVNPDTSAGDTRPATDQQINQWFAGIGDWETLNLGQLAEQLAGQAHRPNVGWALLWVVLALVALETILARLASHAKRGAGHEGLATRVLGGLQNLRDADAGTPGRAA